MNWLSNVFSPQTLQHMLLVFGYPAVTFFVLIESAGIPLPGETMLLFASFYAATTHQLNPVIIIICAALGAIIGDNLGYLAGRTGGRRFVERFGRYFFLKTAHLDKAEQLFSRHGAKAVFFGRFITILRIWAAFLAGVNRMPWPMFLIYNAAGGIAWSLWIGLLGFLTGTLFRSQFNQVEHIVKYISWGGFSIFVLLILIAFIVVRLRRRKTSTTSQP